jgi:hypothetical protein
MNARDDDSEGSSPLHRLSLSYRGRTDVLPLLENGVRVGVENNNEGKAIAGKADQKYGAK